MAAHATGTLSLAYKILPPPVRQGGILDLNPRFPLLKCGTINSAIVPLSTVFNFILAYYDLAPQKSAFIRNLLFS